MRGSFLWADCTARAMGRSFHIWCGGSVSGVKGVFCEEYVLQVGDGSGM